MLKLNPIERSFFSLETPTTLQTIACICPLDSLPSTDSFRQAVDNSIQVMPRLQDRLSNGGPFGRRSKWESDPNFSLSNHIFPVHFLGVNSPEDLYVRAAELFYRPFDFQHPLWRFFIISSSPAPSDSRKDVALVHPAILLTVHHGYVDGLGGLEIMNTVCSRVAVRHGKGSHLHSVPASALTSDPESPQRPSVSQDPDAGSELVKSPLREISENKRSKLLPLLRLLQESREPQVESAVNGTNSERRNFNLADLPLDRLNRLKRPVDGTVNDILLSLITESLRRYSRELGMPLPETARMVLPVSLRNRKDRHILGNHVSAVGLRLPLSTPDQLGQIREIRRETLRIKSTDIAKTYALFAKLTTLLPISIQRRLCEYQAKRTAFICTNMNVSARPQEICGSRILGNYPLPALMRCHGIAYGFVRYTDKICAAVVSDPAIVARPGRLTELLLESLASLEVRVFGSEKLRATEN